MKLAVSKCSPEMAVPITVKMPEPITAPMPSEVSDHGPRLRFRECAGSSASRISLSMDFRASSWLGTTDLFCLRAGAARPRNSHSEYKPTTEIGDPKLHFDSGANERPRPVCIRAPSFRALRERVGDHRGQRAMQADS